MGVWIFVGFGLHTWRFRFGMLLRVYGAQDLTAVPVMLFGSGHASIKRGFTEAVSLLRMLSVRTFLQHVLYLYASTVRASCQRHGWDILKVDRAFCTQ